MFRVWFTVQDFGVQGLGFRILRSVMEGPSKAYLNLPNPTFFVGSYYEP